MQIKNVYPAVSGSFRHSELKLESTQVIFVMQPMGVTGFVSSRPLNWSGGGIGARRLGLGASPSLVGYRSRTPSTPATAQTSPGL